MIPHTTDVCVRNVRTLKFARVKYGQVLHLPNCAELITEHRHVRVLENKGLRNETPDVRRNVQILTVFHISTNYPAQEVVVQRLSLLPNAALHAAPVRIVINIMPVTDQRSRIIIINTHTVAEEERREFLQKLLYSPPHSRHTATRVYTKVRRLCLNCAR